MRAIFLFWVGLMSNYWTYAQTNSFDIRKIQRINLIDYQNVNYSWSYLTEYAIIPKDSVWNFYQTKQKHQPNEDINPARAKKNPLNNSDEQIFIRKIKPDTILQLLEFIQLTQNNYVDLRHFGIDSLWIENNVDSLYQLFLDDGAKQLRQPQISENHQKNLKDKIRNQSIYYDFIANRGWSTSDYPTCAVQIIFKNQDTLHIVSHAQGNYMIPWRIYLNNEQNLQHHYSPFIAQWMGKLINYFDGYSNKKRLLGINFKQNLFEILLNHITNWQVANQFEEVAYKPLDSLQIVMSEIYYDKTTLRKWEKDWNINFYWQNDDEVLVIKQNQPIKFYFTKLIAPIIAHQDSLFAIQKTIKEVFYQIQSEPIFRRSINSIDSIVVNKSFYAADNPDENYIINDCWKIQKDFRLFTNKFTFTIFEKIKEFLTGFMIKK
jgi:hypothetical protein